MIYAAGGMSIVKLFSFKIQMILKPDVGWAQNLKNCGYNFVFFLLGHDGYRIFESVECYDTQNGNYKYLVEI
jgi:hypothetical protein